MNLSDLQNPIANMPHIQQMRAGQENAMHQLPAFTAHQLEDETEEKLTTVQESEEDEEGEGIRDEDKRGERRRMRMSRRAALLEEEVEPEPKRVSDGIHGLHLDLQA